MPAQTRAAKRKNSTPCSLARKRIEPAAAACNYDVINAQSRFVKIAPKGQRVSTPHESAARNLQKQWTGTPSQPAVATAQPSLLSFPTRYVNIALKMPLLRASQQISEPIALGHKSTLAIGPLPTAFDKGSSSSSSTPVPVIIPHQATREFVQIHERFDAEATGVNTLSGKIATTKNRNTRQMLVEAQNQIKQDLSADQQRCRSYIRTEYKQICDEDLPYLQKLKRKILDDIWHGKRYKANLELLNWYLKEAFRIYGGMRDHMDACMNGNAFQQSVFSARLQAFRTKVEQVQAMQATLDGIQRASHQITAIRGTDQEVS